MTDEQRLLYVHGMLLQAEIRMHGMIAENKQREIQGDAMAYTSDDFEKLIIELGVHHNALLVELSGQY